MLDQEQIRQFETQVHEIADERTLAESLNQELVSIFEEEDYEKVRKSTLGNIFEQVFDEEGLSKDLLVSPPEEELVSKERIPTQDGVDGDIAQASIPKDVEKSEISSSTDLDADTVSDVSIDDEPAILDQPAAELIEDDIDEIESLSKSAPPISNVDDDVEISLPIPYRTMPVYDEFKQDVFKPTEIDATQKGGAFDSSLNNILDDASSLLLEDSDLEEIGEGEEYTDEELQAMYTSGEEEYKEQDKYRTSRDFQIEDEKIFFEQIDTYNIYLREAIITILLNDELEDDAERLVDLVLENSMAQVIRYECEKLLQKRIELLNDNNVYTKETLQDKLLTFSEQIRRSTRTLFVRILPIAALIIFVVFYGFFFAVQPIRAWILYERGYKSLQENKLEESEIAFIRAADVWPMQRYFFKYADYYVSQRRFVESGKKYSQLVFGTNVNIYKLLLSRVADQDWFSAVKINDKLYTPLDIINYSKEAFIKLSDYELYVNNNFEKTRAYYNLWLTKYPFDIKMHNQLASVYIEWYDVSQDQRYLDLAREIYDRIIVLSQGDDNSLLHRIRWAVRSRDDLYLQNIVEAILSTKQQIITEEILVPYTELSQYLLQHQKPYYVADVLDQIEAKFPNHPDIPYLYSMYYMQVYQYNMLKSKLLHSIERYETQKNIFVLKAQQYKNYINTYVLLADIAVKEENNLILAQDYITKAQILFESSDQVFFMHDVSEFGKIYFIQSQIALLQGDLIQATNFLEETIQKGYTSLDVQYHQGLISYINQDWEQSSNHFLEMQLNPSVRENTLKMSLLLWSAGNALYFKKNYVAAAVQYNLLLDMLKRYKQEGLNITTINFERETNTISFYNKIAQIQNNLGAALFQVSKSTLNKHQTQTAALIDLQKSSGLLQTLQRSQDVDLVRSIYQEIPLDNIASIISSKRTMPISIYPDIAVSLDNVGYWRAQHTASN